MPDDKTAEPRDVEAMLHLMERLACVVQAMAAGGALHDQIFDIVADIQRAQLRLQDGVPKLKSAEPCRFRWNGDDHTNCPHCGGTNIDPKPWWSA